MRKKRRSCCLGIDVMGADIPPDAIIHAVFELPQEYFSNTSFILYATKDVALQHESHYKEELAHLPIKFRVCKEFVGMDEAPLPAIRKKKESTLIIGLKEQQAGKNDAFLTCANTGALVTASILTLKTIEPILRPALLTLVPTPIGGRVLLDVGASATSSSEQLIQFAYLAASFVKQVLEINKPALALLNIGTETGKGTDELVKAYEWLTKQGKKLPFSFLGNAEPREFFSGELDALVTNGFTGNILLKTAEAVSDFLIESIEKNFPSGQSPDALLPFTELRQVFSQDDALGAILYGVDGYVFKCHGAATTRSLQRAMIGAKGLVQKDLLKSTKSFLAKHLS